MKISWIARALQSPNNFWVDYLYQCLPLNLGLIWRCNLSVKDIKTMSITFPFAKSILLSWAEINYRNLETKFEILEEILCFNSHIKPDGNLLNFPDMIRLGIFAIKDIFCETNQEFLTPAELSNKCGTEINFLLYYRIVSSIPIEWKNILRNSTNTSDGGRVHLIYEWQEYPKISKLAYESLPNKVEYSNLATKIRWEMELGVTFTEKDWAKLCVRANKVTLCTKLCILQHKITQKFVTTNIKLFYYGLKDDKLCTFCGDQPESIVHLFYDCVHVQALWEEVRSILERLLHDNRFKHNARDVMFNTIVKNPLDYLNMITLITKNYIYVTICKNGSLRFIELASMINRYNAMEYYSIGRII